MPLTVNWTSEKFMPPCCPLILSGFKLKIVLKFMVCMLKSRGVWFLFMLFRKYQILSKKANVEKSHLLLVCLLGNSVISKGKQDWKGMSHIRALACHEGGQYYANDPCGLWEQPPINFFGYVIARKRSQTEISSSGNMLLFHCLTL